MSAFTMRSLFWRLGRKLYSWARREASSNFDTNGEHWLLRSVVAKADKSAKSILLDIGAHKGYWSENAASLLRYHKAQGHVHAFEPTSSTYSYLAEKFLGSQVVTANKIAMSDRSGESDFFIAGELAGTNSLLKKDGARVETVNTMRLDDFLLMHQIEHVLLVKSDTEGHDLSVLRGAAETLQKGLIDAWQFEYNHRWITGRSFLKDVFDFIVDKPYLLGKLYGNGIETYEQWHPELERFFESNYVLIRKGGEFETLCSPAHFNKRNVLMQN
ncbi:MAG: FkbM family methyltransferase [Polaromonas sp.]|nr:FkbM family methyltransferase [Polaromonas sp.]MDP3751396.1 FkbM family methyltransferase [Polaromonas sp.]